MFKKISIGLLGAGLFVASAVPAMAMWHMPTMNIAKVNSYTESTAISGNNSQSNIVQVEMASDILGLSGDMGNRYIKSGNSYSNASSLNVVNRSMGWNTMNKANVSSGVVSGAQSGGNLQDQVVNVSKAHDVAAGAIGLGNLGINTGVSNSVATNRNLVNVRVSW